MNGRADQRGERPSAVLFDLDDTLYDHLHCARHGLVSMRERFELEDVPIETLEELYSEGLEAVHVRLLRGEMSQNEARTVRVQQLLATYGIELDDEQALAEYVRFRQDYDAACRVVAGTHELLQQLLGDGLRLAVITNNLVAEQTAKLRQLALDAYFDVVSISEEVGVTKPDPEIFHVTLERLRLPVDRVVLVGDSLESDIAGALGVGMRCVWLDRQPERGRQAPVGVPTIERDFSRHERAARMIAG